MINGIPTLDDLDLQGKRVLIRFDYNVKYLNGKVSDDERILRTLPTLTYVLSKASSVTILSHLGRPEKVGEIDKDFSLKKVAEHLSTLLSEEIYFHDDLNLDHFSDNQKKISMLENVRFFEGETDNNELFSKKLAQLADVFVMDAFGSAHRSHCSTEGVSHFMDSCVGRLVEEELNSLEGILNNPSKPMLGIIGGSKISTKINILESLLEKVDWLFVGGGIANTLHKSKGHEIGQSIVENDFLEEVKDLCKNNKIILPDTFVVEQKDKSIVEKTSEEILPDDIIYDVSINSIKNLNNIISSCKTILWNGPLGFFEREEFSRGTLHLAKVISESDAYSVIGGGETLTAFNQSNLLDKVGYASTAGGAFLEYIEKGSLPSLDALKEKI